ncbi:hypothetical protein ACN6QX_05270, partial [Acinetobacter baumannii]
MMKKVLFVLMGMLIVGCTEKKPLTPEEQWHGYCTSVGNAARSILFDRQQAIEKSQAIELSLIHISEPTRLSLPSG